jgi:hypothetical protein
MKRMKCGTMSDIAVRQDPKIVGHSTKIGITIFYFRITNPVA